MPVVRRHRVSRHIRGLLQHVDVLLRADVLQLFGPHGDGHFAQMGRAQQVHERPRLTDAAADAKRNPVVEDRPMLWQLEEIFLAGELELHLQRILGHPDPHAGEFVTALGDGIPHQDVAVEAVGVAPRHL